MLEEASWTCNEWRDEAGHRHLSVSLSVYVKAYVRQTRATRYRSDSHGKYARQYIDSQNTMKDLFRIILAQEGVEPFGKQPLGCSINVYGPNTLRSDLGNLEKAVEDAANGNIWHDDRWIYQRGPGFKAKSDKDWLELEVWEL
jgi:Holliday junction resolvase RusA-like endonuclease